jgi:hypothetical protein
MRTAYSLLFVLTVAAFAAHVCRWNPPSPAQAPVASAPALADGHKTSQTLPTNR